MGRGRSKSGATKSSAKATATKKATTAPAKQTVAKAAAPKLQPIKDYNEAFGAGQDFESTNDVNHYSRTVSPQLQKQWNSYTDQYGKPLTAKQEKDLMKEWDPYTDELYGYVRTTNSFKINQALYDPKNAGKSDAQIFTRKDRNGRLRDLETVKTLDKAISTHKTPADAAYERFGSANSVKATFDFSDSEMKMIESAHKMSPSQLAQLNANIQGRSSYSKAYTSTSANRSMNAFKNPKTKQAKGFYYERRISVPKGTNALAMKKNAQESEVIFGRGMETRITGISIGKDGHTIIHEEFVRYR